MKSLQEILSLQLRLETAARVLVYAQDFKPGDDLGASATAVAWLALRASLKALDRAALKALDDAKFEFDAPTALEELRKIY